MPFAMAGFLLGSSVGLFGVGGGEIFIPTLIYVFVYAQHQAQVSVAGDSVAADRSARSDPVRQGPAT